MNSPSPTLSIHKEPFSARKGPKGKAAGLLGPGHLSRLPGIRVKARRFFRTQSQWVSKTGTAGARNTAANCSISWDISNPCTVSKAASRTPTVSIHDALVEIRDLSVGPAAEQKSKRKGLRANKTRVELLAALASLPPTFKALLQASMRLAAPETIPSRRAGGVETQGHGRSDHMVSRRELLSPSHLKRGHLRGGIPALSIS